MKTTIIILCLLLLVSVVSATNPPQITSVSPDRAYNVGVVTVTVYGNDLNAIAIYMSKCGSGMVVGTITSKSSTSVTADFNIKGRTPGTASIRLNNADGQIATFPFTVLGDISTITSTPTPTSSIYVPATPETPGYSTTTAEPDEVITYIYNIPTTTQIVPRAYRDYVTPISDTTKGIPVAATTIKPPAPTKIVTTSTPKSVNNTILIPISILIILSYIIIKRE